MQKSSFIVRIDNEAAKKYGRYELQLTPDITPEKLKAALVSLVAKVFAWEEDILGISLNNRLTRLRNRMKTQGHTYKERMAMSMMDVISRDKQLRAVFEGILKKYQALYGTVLEGGEV